jgi:M6 family metalloprotease-like protein
MQKKSSSQSGLFNPRLLLTFILCSASAFLAVLSFAAKPASPGRGQKSVSAPSEIAAASQPPFTPVANTVTNGGLTVLARVFTPGGWVKPGDTFPVVLTYGAGGTGATGVTIRVTLNNASIFQTSTPAANSGNGTAGSPLTYNVGLVPANGTGQIVIEARAKNLTEDPEVMWKDISADLTLQTTGQPALPARTHGPKVTTQETARFGDRPFPVVMVQYQDIKHCTDVGTPYPECTGNHTAAAFDASLNSRTTGKSVWQLFNDMSFGQLYLDGKVSPAPNSPTTPFTPGYVHKFSMLAPAGTCSGVTLGAAYGTPAYANRIEDGWYLLPGNQGYYGADGTGHALAGALTGQGLLFGIDNACGPTGKIAYDAASLADPDIDYNDFDTDKDGVVDFFIVAFAGDGGNGSTSLTGINNVWPHSSDLRAYFTDANGLTGYVSNDQFRNKLNQLVYYTDATRTAQTTTPTAFPVYVRVGPYNADPEASVESVSTIAHEYAHALGLPDFYSTGSRGTYGSWDIGGTDYFQYMTIFSRQEMGWLVPKPLPNGTVTLTESKFDTGQIDWARPDGTPYTLTGTGIHNGNVYRMGLPPRLLINSVPSGTRAWYSGSGNAFGCATDGGGHNLDFFIPDLQQYGAATAVTLKFKHLYEIEWDYDYGFVLVSDDGGRTWTSLVSQNSSTISNTWNPNANACQAAYNNGITGVSEGPGGNNTASNPNRLTGTYPPATFINDQFDLTPYKGKEIILRFSYSTDPGLAKRGWFIDDIEIKADNTVVYASDFEASQESTRIFPSGWARISSADGSPADHAYYIELRDRISNDFDGKGQSERGTPTWEGGVSMIYTDEAHGYGNFGVDDPPAETPVDSVPQPGNETPNLDDAAFTLARPVFNGCTHIDNYTDPNGPGGLWKLPNGLKFTVTSITGMSPGPNLPATPASATLVAELYPDCNVDVAPPVLSVGTGYENPDTDGAYQLAWTRPLGAAGPDLLQVATTCGPFFFENAESGLGQWTVTTDAPGGVYPGTNWGSASNEKPNHAGTTFRARAAEGAMNVSAILTYNNPITIPTVGATSLTWEDWTMNEGDDSVFVEVSDDNGATWNSVYTYARSALAPDAAPAFANEPLFPQAVDLAAYEGKTIRFRFRYFVGPDDRAGSTPLGWYIDNIAITNSDWTDLVTTSGTSFVDHKPSGSYCYRVRTTFLVGGQTPLPSPFSNIVNVTVAPGIPRIVSRKTHGTAGPFDVDLPLTGPSGIECRRGGGANSDTHQVVFQFGQPVTFTGASATPQSGKTGQVTGTSGSGTNEVTVNLGNVSNAQTITVNLTGVSGAGTAANLSVPMGVLLGDVTADRFTNSFDVSQTKTESGKPVTDDNFRKDVTAEGFLNSFDVTVVKSKSGTGLGP